MGIRPARAGDREQVRNMWEYAFNEEEPFLSWYFDHYWHSESALVAEFDEPYSAYVAEDGATQNWIGASLEMVPYSIMVRGEKQETSYIVGVAVAPELRGKGTAKQLMRRALDWQNDRGQTVSLLLPFSYAFYRKLGYELCYSLKYLECTMKDLRPLCRSYGRVIRMDETGWESLDSVYSRQMAKRNGYIVRDRERWQFILDMMDRAGGFAYVAENDQEEPEGYITFLKSRERIRVKELCYLNENALGALLQFLSSHFSIYDSIYFDLPADSHLGFLMDDPRAACIERPYVMGRVVNVLRALEHAVTDGVLTLEIRDSLMEENDGIFMVSNGKACKTAEAKPDANMDISVFSQIYLGFLSPREEFEAGRIKINGAQVLEQLEKIFPKQNNYINHVLADE